MKSINYIIYLYRAGRLLPFEARGRLNADSRVLTGYECGL